MLKEVEEVTFLAEQPKGLKVLRQHPPSEYERALFGEGQIPSWAIPAAIVGVVGIAVVGAVYYFATLPPPVTPPTGALLSATASASPTSGTAPLTVAFTVAPSGGTAPYSYAWNFGDGGSSTSENPSYVYQSAGSYTATVTVTDSTGATAQSSVAVTVSSTTTPPTTGQQSVTITATSSITDSQYWAIFNQNPGAYQGGDKWANAQPIYQEVHQSGDTMTHSLAPGTYWFAITGGEYYTGSITTDKGTTPISNVNYGTATQFSA